MGRHKHYLSDNIQEWADRVRARQTLLAAANTNRLSWASPVYRMRHLQRAAHICRQRRLVHPDILVMAGFKGYKV